VSLIFVPISATYPLLYMELKLNLQIENGIKILLIIKKKKENNLKYGCLMICSFYLKLCFALLDV